MEKGNLTQDEIFEKEESCIKSIKNIAKAAVMRILTGGILMAVMVMQELALWIYLMLTVVFLLIISTTFPLLKEMKKQIDQLQYLRSLETE